MKEDKKLEKVIHECYVELYKSATPKADFNDLLAKAEINEEGEKVIDFMSYSIPSELMESIVEKTIKKYKIKSKLSLDKFKFNVYLGASPKFC